MSSTIWKYPLDVQDRQVLDLPTGWQPLTVATQEGDPFLWVRVDPTAPTESVAVYTHGTGHPTHPNATRYLGTYQFQGGVLMFHVFTQKED